MFKSISGVLLIFILILSFISSSCLSLDGFGGVPAAGLVGGSQPEWVRDPYTRYDRQGNVAVVGNGGSRETAEKDALGKLIAQFGQSIQVDDNVSTSYQEAAKSGVTADWSETTTINTTVLTSSAMDSLVGAEIGDVWNNGSGVTYAVAVLNKARARQIYSDMLKANQAMIDNLVNIPEADKTSLD